MPLQKHPPTKEKAAATGEAAIPGEMDLGGDSGWQRTLDSARGISPSQSRAGGSESREVPVRGGSTAARLEAREAAPKMYWGVAHGECGEFR